MGLPLPRAMGSTLLSLIPKKPAPRKFSDFRPISLANFVSKVATRILATRLQPILLRVIPTEQAEFLKGRDISDHILMAKEMTHHLDKKNPWIKRNDQVRYDESI